jgi:hypothetical protein
MFSIIDIFSRAWGLVKPAYSFLRISQFTSVATFCPRRRLWREIESRSDFVWFKVNETQSEENLRNQEA